MKSRGVSPGTPGHITQLLIRWNGGDSRVKSELMTLVYPQLRQIAARHLSSRPPNPAFQKTELVHDAFLRLAEQKRVSSHSRAHFLALCAEIMRRILVDDARRRASLKKGADVNLLPLDENSLPVRRQHRDLIALDDVLQTFARRRPEYCRIVELRFFGGLTLEEISETLGISMSTVTRRWRFARAWLRREISRVGD